ncbi:MAG: hypothetical protein A2201_11200 [Alicyclobacillus sp. RIFOXYA1_FULL_53_8]|nr:MAG: hypothetical protein A2201_11200 [Alicyclobacillus sp. RIFOXYA1_FULL_53_8]
MLSEERYFDASALTVYELLFSPQYLGLNPADLQTFRPQLEESEVRAVRHAVFVADEVLHAMKQVGINANWDMVYLQAAFQLAQLLEAFKAKVGDTEFFATLLPLAGDGWTQQTLQEMGHSVKMQQIEFSVRFGAYLEFMSGCTSKQELFERLETKFAGTLADQVPSWAQLRQLWDLGQSTFQEWYLGDEYVTATRQPGKRGFLADEVPIVEPHRFAGLLASLRNKGLTLGIATGRPSLETRVPLHNLGWLEYFAEGRISTASDVLAAEMEYPEKRPLAKPNPFSYLRSYLQAVQAADVWKQPLPLPAQLGDGVLIIGDSVADLLAARSMGCRFAAVLTGLEGEAAREQFVRMGSDYIFDNVLEVAGLLGVE